MKKCVYCGGEIGELNQGEHIIQNALGGRYASTKICCKDCNNIINDLVDIKFNSIFNGITSNIPDLNKSHGKDSIHSCEGLAISEGKEYNVTIKSGKVVYSRQYSDEKKKAAKGNIFDITGYSFPIDNRSFKNGICKIAFNFALDHCVDHELLLKKVDLKRDEKGLLTDINFNYRLIPFYPLNSFDKYIELNSEMELYHKLILFSQGKNLWCYVDLFDTFQYYVHLTDQWIDEPVYFDYVQSVQRKKLDISEVKIRRPKDTLTFGAAFDIKPSLDIEDFNIKLTNAKIKEKMSDVIGDQLPGYLQFISDLYGIKNEEWKDAMQNVFFYFDDDNGRNRLKPKSFRITTNISIDSQYFETSSYPQLLTELLDKHVIDPKDYTLIKFERLNKFLISLGSMSSVQ